MAYSQRQPAFKESKAKKKEGHLRNEAEKNEEIITSYCRAFRMPSKELQRLGKVIRKG